MHPAEYGIILLTFGAINLFGLELGMCAGVLVAMTHFIADYARARAAVERALSPNPNTSRGARFVSLRPTVSQTALGRPRSGTAKPSAVAHDMVPEHSTQVPVCLHT